MFRPHQEEWATSPIDGEAYIKLINEVLAILQVLFWFPCIMTGGIPLPVDKVLHLPSNFLPSNHLFNLWISAQSWIWLHLALSTWCQLNTCNRQQSPYSAVLWLSIQPTYWADPLS